MYFNNFTECACVCVCVYVCVCVCTPVFVPGEVVEDAVLGFHQLIQHTLPNTIHQRNTSQLVSLFRQTLKHNINAVTEWLKQKQKPWHDSGHKHHDNITLTGNKQMLSKYG